MYVIFHFGQRPNLGVPVACKNRTAETAALIFRALARSNLIFV